MEYVAGIIALVVLWLVFGALRGSWFRQDVAHRTMAQLRARKVDEDELRHFMNSMDYQKIWRTSFGNTTAEAASEAAVEYFIETRFMWYTAAQSEREARAAAS